MNKIVVRENSREKVEERKRGSLTVNNIEKLPMEYYIEKRKWEQIFEFLKGIKGIHSKNEKRLRIFMEVVWYIARSGCQWRLLPEIYGNYRSIHRRFKKWCEKGVWEKLHKYKQDPDLEVQMIDGTIVRAHACSAGYKKNSGGQQALGRSRDGFSTKIHALVDALENPLKFALTPGQRNDITQAEALTENVSNSTVVADKAMTVMLSLPILKVKVVNHQNETEKCKGIMTNMFIKNAI